MIFEADEAENEIIKPKPKPAPAAKEPPAAAPIEAEERMLRDRRQSLEQKEKALLKRLEKIRTTKKETVADYDDRIRAIVGQAILNASKENPEAIKKLVAPFLTEHVKTKPWDKPFLKMVDWL